MTVLSDAILTCNRLANLISEEHGRGANLTTQVISVSCPDFRILFVPVGAEANAKMELNEVLR